MDFHDDMPASFSNVQTYDDEDLPATQLLCPFEEKDSDINNTNTTTRFADVVPLDEEMALFYNKWHIFATNGTFLQQMALSCNKWHFLVINSTFCTKCHFLPTNATFLQQMPIFSNKCHFLQTNRNFGKKCHYLATNGTLLQQMPMFLLNFTFFSKNARICKFS